MDGAEWPGGEFAQTDIYQAKTIGAGQCTAAIPRRRITGSTLHDDSPTIVLVPAADGRSGAHMAWSRNEGERGTSGALVWSKAGCGGQWSAPQLLDDAGVNPAPDMTWKNSVDLDFVAWAHDTHSAAGVVSMAGQVHSDGSLGFTYSMSTRLGGDSLHVALSMRHILFLLRVGERLGVVEDRVPSTQFAYLTGPRSPQQAIAVTSNGTTFTAFGASFGSHRLYSIAVT